MNYVGYFDNLLSTLNFVDSTTQDLLDKTTGKEVNAEGTSIESRRLIGERYGLYYENKKKSSYHEVVGSVQLRNAANFVLSSSVWRGRLTTSPANAT